jgi:NAD(P)-dependent dehydrogenase (short-subunit alcohol dehydrogenase family)
VAHIIIYVFDADFSNETLSPDFGLAMKTILITGTSSGIGRATALHLARRNYKILAGVRTTEDAHSIIQESQEKIIPVFLDVSSQTSIHNLLQQVEVLLEGKGLDGLINNAGIACGGPIEFLPLTEMRNTFEVNFFGPLTLIQTFLPLLRRAPMAHIINISSVQGKLAFPFMAPYSASKFALEALSDCLRQELNQSSIKVSVIEPGMTDTAILKKGKTYLEEHYSVNLPDGMLRHYGGAMKSLSRVLNSKPKFINSSHKVATKVEHILNCANPNPRYRVGLDSKIALVLKTLFSDRRMDKLIRRFSIVKDKE